MSGDALDDALGQSMRSCALYVVGGLVALAAFVIGVAWVAKHLF